MMKWWSNLKQSRTFQATINVAAGQIVGDAVAAVFVIFQDKFPWLIKGTEKVLRRTIIDPNLEWFEGIADKYHYTTEADREKRKTETKDERAHRIAAPLTELAATGMVGTAAAYVVQRFVEKKAHAGFENILFSRTADTAVHIGSLIVMNTTMNKQTTKASHACSKILQNLGVSKETADRTSDYFIRRKPADLAGFATGLAVLSTGVTPLNYVRR